MSIGRTFKESLQKVLRSLETDQFGLGSDGNMKLVDKLNGLTETQQREIIEQELRITRFDRIFYIAEALRRGWDIDRVQKLTTIDFWFLSQIAEIIEAEKEFIESNAANGLTAENVLKMKELGFSDIQLGFLSNRDNLIKLHERGESAQKEYSKTIKVKETEVRTFRKTNGIIPGYRLVDTCGGEFEAFTPYYYSAYDNEDEVKYIDERKVMILGGGPNRIGQGIEFDYCCCHASYALEEENVKSIMVNSNPETVSTDYDTSDSLYFEPLTLEDILHIYEKEKPEGVIVQFGGQTPLRLANVLQENGVNILGTSPDSIDRAEDRERFAQVVRKLNILQPENGIAYTQEDAIKVATNIGYPVLVRPSYVLGGRAMSIVYDEQSLVEYIRTAVDLSPEHPILVDDFLEDAVEIDVDAIYDGDSIFIGSIMEHVEEAGVHSGDSACIIPTMSITPPLIEDIKRTTEALAKELGVIGLLNIQFAIKDSLLYVIEVNPRASRTVPFVSKATGVPLAKIAVKIMLGRKLKEFGLTEMIELPYISVKEAVLPFNKFPGVDTLLSPEMKSTGEVMGISEDFGESFFKATLATGDRLPVQGTVFLTVNRKHKPELLDHMRKLVDAGFKLVGTEGTAKYCEDNGIECRRILKVSEGRPHVIDLIKNDEIDLIINTPTGKVSRGDAFQIRQSAVRHHIPIMTSVSAAKAAIEGMLSIKKVNKIGVKSIQEYHKEVNKG